MNILINFHSSLKFAAIIKFESHDQNDEISKPLNLSGTFCERHVRKISDVFWPNCEHFSLMSMTNDLQLKTPNQMINPQH